LNRNAKGFLTEFKEFISRGNVIDLAVGIIIGGAFTTITNSLVNDIVMPLVGLFIRAETFSTLSFTVGSAVFPIGSFLQAIFDFVVMALVIFLIVKVINRLRRKKEQEPPPPPAPSAEAALLTEIRDLLKEKEADG